MAKRIRIINSKDNWYHIGEEYEVRDENAYDIGIQVVRPIPEGRDRVPDVVMHGHYEFIN